MDEETREIKEKFYYAFEEQDIIDSEKNNISKDGMELDRIIENEPTEEIGEEVEEEDDEQIHKAYSGHNSYYDSNSSQYGGIKDFIDYSDVSKNNNNIIFQQTNDFQEITKNKKSIANNKKRK